MEEQNQNTITAFDALFTTNQIQMLKILLPRLAPEHQSGFAVYIKLLELQYAFTFLRRHTGTRLFGNTKQLSADFFQGDNTDTIALLDELLPFSGPSERSKIENMKNMILNFKKMQEMMEMIKMMQELFPEGMGTDNPFSQDNPMDLFSGMSDSGLSSIFEMFGNMGKED